MLPGVYGFKWAAGNLIFLGIFYSVLIVVACTLVTAVVRAVRDYRSTRRESIRWKADFEDLPQTARTCRHELSGELKGRTCPNGFDCRSCIPHAELARRRPEGTNMQGGDPDVFGFDMPADRMYHRGHTWIRQEEDGTLTVGLDDFASRLIGRPDWTELPPPGSAVQTNGTGWYLIRGDTKVRILSPIDGEVLATGGAGIGWYLKIKPLENPLDTRHLLRKGEIRPWIMKEIERLLLALSAGQLGPNLADGGLPVQDFRAAIPDADWDTVLAEIFLQP